MGRRVWGECLAGTDSSLRTREHGVRRHLACGTQSACGIHRVGLCECRLKCACARGSRAWSRGPCDPAMAAGSSCFDPVATHVRPTRSLYVHGTLLSQKVCVRALSVLQCRRFDETLHRFQAGRRRLQAQLLAEISTTDRTLTRALTHSLTHSPTHALKLTPTAQLLPSSRGVSQPRRVGAGPPRVGK